MLDSICHMTFKILEIAFLYENIKICHSVYPKLLWMPLHNFTKSVNHWWFIGFNT